MHINSDVTLYRSYIRHNQLSLHFLIYAMKVQYVVHINQSLKFIRLKYVSYTYPIYIYVLQYLVLCTMCTSMYIVQVCACGAGLDVRKEIAIKSDFAF